MILAAGLGTRLRPLTNRMPKALVVVGGVPMLERVARRLVEAGARRLVVNVSPHADRIRAFLREADLEAEIVVSEEPDGPLETGGGLRRAAPLFEAAAPFLMHNVDLLTDIDLRALFDAHAPERLATLAVRPPETERYLLFDEEGLLGYAYGGRETRVREPRGEERPLDFCGVQCISPGIFRHLEVEEERFSIISTYLRLVREGERVMPHHVGDALWIDIGTHERLEEAERVVAAGRV